MANAKSVHGFTLVELIVTLVIIGALAAVSAPLFFTHQTFAERGFVNETRAAMRYAQKLAVSSGCAVQVQFAANAFSLTRSGNAADCNDGAYTEAVGDPSSPGSGFTRTAPSSVTVSSAPATFVFQPLGNVAGAGADVTVSVSGQSFVISRATGYVQ